jgi:thioredoxin-like negative regulator of GroEL
MVDFTASWCYWCRRLDETTYKNKEVISLAEKFISAKVDCDKEYTIAQKYKIRGLPTILFMDADGQVLHSVVGYRSPEDFLIEMKKVLELPITK